MPQDFKRRLAILYLCCVYFSYALTDRLNAFETWSEKSDCRDTDSSCQDWAKNGECDKNPKFMHTKCPLACKLCEAPTIDPSSYAGEVLVLNCSLGQIRILPYFKATPVTASLVLELAHHVASETASSSSAAGAKGCNFYRNEAVPQYGSGPPYGLLQGSLAGLLRVPELEGAGVEMKRGHVAMIPGTREFFINAMDHPGWGDSMTVWGQLADGPSMDVVQQLLALPYHEVKHPVYGTVMRMLDEQVPFVPIAEKAGSRVE